MRHAVFNRRNLLLASGAIILSGSTCAGWNTTTAFLYDVAVGLTNLIMRSVINLSKFLFPKIGLLILALGNISLGIQLSALAGFINNAPLFYQSRATLITATAFTMGALISSIYSNPYEPSIGTSVLPGVIIVTGTILVGVAASAIVRTLFYQASRVVALQQAPNTAPPAP